ncbi:hypothetical protein Nepgr_029605 [Nepenthes gracilis]|uniref:Uncharacterized protein n=1 Tax=Nepenthes gracilis TaxID=150966 RepID=A0AAD3Y355_NEPGR|nr:hypothetical protein Nepgr_029605 [Nepenthes gracilis]
MLLEANATQTYLAALIPEGREDVSGHLESCLIDEIEEEPDSADSFQVGFLGALDSTSCPLRPSDRREEGVHSHHAQEEAALISTPSPSE